MYVNEVHTAKSSHFHNKINRAPDMRNRLLCENMKASKPIAIMFCLEYVMKENRLKTRQFERVCVIA